MKTLSDGKTVTSRSYYYLLDFNDFDNWKTISSMFGVMKLCDLTIKEYKELWNIATNKEFN